MVFPLIFWILGAVATATVIFVICLFWNKIVEWFRNRNDIKNKDRDNIAFTLQQKLDSGNYKTVQGIFNQGSNTMLDSTVIEHEQMDRELASNHQGQELVIYQ